MIKRIIFDIDNTLLDTKMDGINCFNEYLKNKSYNLSPSEFFKILCEYENIGNYEVNDLIAYLNQYLENGYTEDDFLELLNMYSSYSTLINENTPNILEYLSKKYEIVALTNWYSDCQSKRLNKVGILKYFNKVYGVSDGIKPNVDVYTNACSDYKYSECLIIGDNYDNDICVPMKLGMNTIYFNRLSDNNDNEINNLNELINRL